MNYNISINNELAVIVDKAMRERKYANRSEFFRDLIRRFYVEREDHIIEEVHSDDPDYKYIDKNPKEENYISMEEMIKELNV